MLHNETKIKINNCDVTLHFNIQSTLFALKAYNLHSGNNYELADLDKVFATLQEGKNMTDAVEIFGFIFLFAAKEYSEFQGEFDSIIGIKYPETIKPEYKDRYAHKLFSNWFLSNQSEIGKVLSVMMSGWGAKKPDIPGKSKKKE